MNKKKYIEADKILEKLVDMRWALSEREQYKEGYEDCLDEIEIIIKDDLPSAEVEEVQHGRWISSVSKYNFYVEVCSECGYIEEWNLEINRNFCPNCGAKMK